MKRIQIFLPVERSRPGHLHLFKSNGVMVLSNLRALGKADNARASAEGNKHRHVELPYGDTPAGTYAGELVMFRQRHKRLGRGWIALDPLSGDALSAKRNGRYGLGIHAGRGDDRLVPTYGCIRLLDHDFESLAHNIVEGGVLVAIEDV